ncbi:MAG: hypothetical protein JSS65_02310 [Armatimonadetes bacterium]|nr:hypothetical protein [Armatimonadota bacterium]
MRLSHVFWTTIALLGASLGQAITLDMTMLPTAQGWNYLVDGNRASISEAAAFSVSGGSLHQSLTGHSYGSGGYALYSRANPFADVDFYLEATAQVVKEESTTPKSPYGLSFGVATNYGYALFGIASDRYALYNKPAVAFDGTQVHTYRLVGKKATKTMDLFIDGVQVVNNQAMPQINSNLGLFFADSTGYTNTDGKLLSYGVVPEPATGLAALLLLPVLRRRRK